MDIDRRNPEEVESGLKKVITPEWVPHVLKFWTDKESQEDERSPKS